LFRSTNGGNTFSGAKIGIDVNEHRAWNSPIVHDPIHTLRVFTGTERVYRSLNGASSWTPISPPLGGSGYAPDNHADPDSPRGRDVANAHGANSNSQRNHTITCVQGVVETIAVSPLNTQIIWAGTDDGHVWVTPNDGASWSEVSPVSSGQWVTRVACDPFD